MMTVYVDPATHPYGRMMMCHMAADSRDELLSVVDAIGVHRKWIQHAGTEYEHFDICKEKRTKAVALGAVEVNHRQILLFMIGKRKAAEAGGLSCQPQNP